MYMIYYAKPQVLCSRVNVTNINKYYISVQIQEFCTNISAKKYTTFN